MGEGKFFTDTFIADLVKSLRLQAETDFDDAETNECGETDDYEMSFEGVQDNLASAADVIEHLQAELKRMQEAA